jgi:hypothetical protein
MGSLLSEERGDRKRRRQREEDAEVATEEGLVLSEDAARHLLVTGYAMTLHPPPRADLAPLVGWEGMRQGRPYPPPDASPTARLLLDRFDARLLLHRWEAFAKPPRALRVAALRELWAAGEGEALGPGWSLEAARDAWSEAFRDAVAAEGGEGDVGEEGVGSPPPVHVMPTTWRHAYSVRPLPLRLALPPTQAAARLIETTARRVAAAPQLEFVLRLKQGEQASFSFLDARDALHPYYTALRARAGWSGGAEPDWPGPIEETAEQAAAAVEAVEMEAAKKEAMAASGRMGMGGLVAYGDSDDDAEAEASASEPAAAPAGPLVASYGEEEEEEMPAAPEREGAPSRKRSRFTSAGDASEAQVPRTLEAAASPPAPLSDEEELMTRLLARAAELAVPPEPGKAAAAFLRLAEGRERGNRAFAFLFAWSPANAAWTARRAALMQALEPGAVAVGASAGGEEAVHVPQPAPAPARAPRPAWLKAALARGWYGDEDSDEDLDHVDLDPT